MKVVRLSQPLEFRLKKKKKERKGGKKKTPLHGASLF